MKKNNLTFSIMLILVSSLGLVNCNDDFDSAVNSAINAQKPGTADFSHYVALGNSLTSGYANGALYQEGQQNAYPVMLATRFKQAFPNMTAFKIPLTQDNLGGLLLSGTQIATPKLYLNENFKPAVMSGNPTTDITKNIYTSGGFQNMGIPGAKSYHLLVPGYGSVANVPLGKANPYFAYFASSATTTVLADALAQEPTFFTLWIGNNDVLGYATGGGDEVGKNQAGNIDPSTYGSSDISDPRVVAGSIQAIITQLTALGAKGVVGNIPDVSTVPYFTTVAYNPITLTAQQATALNTAYATYNATLKQLVIGGLITAAESDSRQIVFKEGAGNSPVFIDPALTNLSVINVALLNYRQVKSGELITLPAGSLLGTLKDPNNANSVIGLGYPLEGKYVLTAAELTKINTAVASYNVAIKTVISAFGDKVALADLNATMKELSSTSNNPKFMFDGVQYSTKYITGSAFSLDGVHPTPKGYALIANEYIRTINKAFGASLLEFNPSVYPGL